jgi:hypothetical protein
MVVEGEVEQCRESKILGESEMRQERVRPCWATGGHSKKAVVVVLWCVVLGKHVVGPWVR